ncbi:MAG: TetR/AcrR family transcriptional regulator [Ruminococcus flavefaciens]|nr:TetR/AcrR family transcriptional regulator [Ruminococcus flavefaciens]
MGKIDKNKEQKENSLLKTAFEFFTTKGFSKTSISDIANKAGVAKGTFYLYFKDKYDIRNRLVSHKSSQLFRNAVAELEENMQNLDFEDRIIKIVDNIVNQLNENQSLLTFISKNLSWGVFKNALTSPANDDDINFSEIYYSMLDDAPYEFTDPEIMLFMIIELVSSTCYSAILYSEPCTLDELKPHLYDTIRMIIERHKQNDKIQQSE